MPNSTTVCLRWVAMLAAIVLITGCAAEKSADRMPAPDAPEEMASEENSPGDASPIPTSATAPSVGMPETPPLQNSPTAEMAMELAFEMPDLADEEESTSATPPRKAARRPAAISSPDETETPDLATSPNVSNEGSAPGEPKSTGPFESLPAGASHDADNGYATIPVFYATDRASSPIPLSSYQLSGNRDAVILLSGSAVAFFGYAGFCFVRRRRHPAISFGVLGAAASLCAGAVVTLGVARIEKHGVSYSSDRGPLARGIAQVTVPDVHDKGQVERPSLLRFEIREDQREHIVLTSAIELTQDDFTERLSETVSLSPDKDLLVFVHGYNVGFESAIQRTAQIAVDLPFEGVPVCYSWPSEGKLLGYLVDETNAAWTQSHLKQFLLELARDSGAQSINIVAHSMGNRPTTGALVEIGWELRSTIPEKDKSVLPKLFDRVVLAAPDVDADRFKNDLASKLTEIAEHVTLYASSDDRALIASKKVHGYPRAGESGDSIVVVPGIETVDVSGIDLSLLGHSYYGDDKSMLHDLHQNLQVGLPANNRHLLSPRLLGEMTYWKLIRSVSATGRRSDERTSIR